MAFDWNLYLKLAEELMESHEEQAKLRTAISRAYYAAFNRCRIKSEFSSYKKGDIHEKVINYFKSQNDSISFTIGNNLDSLRKTRNYADYTGQFEINWREVNIQIVLAQDIIQNLEDIHNL